jgi:hypothetical protein
MSYPFPLKFIRVFGLFGLVVGLLWLSFWGFFSGSLVGFLCTFFSRCFSWVCGWVSYVYFVALCTVSLVYLEALLHFF